MNRFMKKLDGTTEKNIQDTLARLDNETNKEITTEELEAAIRKLSNEKAAEHDEIRGDMINYLSQIGKQALHRIINLA